VVLSVFVIKGGSNLVIGQFSLVVSFVEKSFQDEFLSSVLFVLFFLLLVAKGLIKEIEKFHSLNIMFILFFFAVCSSSVLSTHAQRCFVSRL